jgi:ferredoxin
MAYEIKIDQASCIGCGACVATCPECFDMDEKKGKAKAKKPKCDSPCAQDAADNCPVEAIAVKKV